MDSGRRWGRIPITNMRVVHRELTANPALGLMSALLIGGFFMAACWSGCMRCKPNVSSAWGGPGKVKVTKVKPRISQTTRGDGIQSLVRAFAKRMLNEGFPSSLVKRKSQLKLETVKSNSNFFPPSVSKRSYKKEAGALCQIKAEGGKSSN